MIPATPPRAGMQAGYLVYCLVGPGTGRSVPARSRPTGIDGEPVRLAAGGGVAAAFSDCPQLLSVTRDRILAYQAVVEAFHEKAAVLPVRYGTVADSRAELRRWLLEGGVRYRRLLEQLRGLVEMGVRIGLPDRRGAGTADPIGGPSASSGAEYLRLRAQPPAEAADILRRLERAYPGRVRAFRHGPPGGLTPFDTPVSSLFFLIDREGADDFRRAFRDVERGVSLPMLLTGPWPPYSFVAEDAEGTPRTREAHLHDIPSWQVTAPSIAAAN